MLSLAEIKEMRQLCDSLQSCVESGIYFELMDESLVTGKQKETIRSTAKIIVDDIIDELIKANVT